MWAADTWSGETETIFQQIIENRRAPQACVSFRLKKDSVALEVQLQAVRHVCSQRARDFLCFYYQMEFQGTAKDDLN